MLDVFRLGRSRKGSEMTFVYAVQCIRFGKDVEPSQELVGVATSPHRAYEMAREHLAANSSGPFPVISEPTEIKPGWWSLHVRNGLYYRVIGTPSDRIIRYEQASGGSPYGNCSKCGREFGPFDYPHGDGYGDAECSSCLRASNS